MSDTENTEVMTIEGFDPRKLFSQGLALGTADLIQGGSLEEAVGRTLISLLLYIRDKEGKPPFAGVVVILPPSSATSLTSDSVHEALASGFYSMTGAAPDDKQAAFLNRMTHVVNSPTLEVGDLEATISEHGQHRLVAIAEANLYRDNTIEELPAFGVSAVRTSEDFWAPHVTRLCHIAVSAVKTTMSYAIVHVDESPATQARNVDMLTSVDGCYVVELLREPDAKDHVETNAQRWVSLVLCGEMAAVVSEIEEMELSEVNRLHLLAQLFSRAGRPDEALEALTQLTFHSSTMEPTSSIQASWLAFKAGSRSLALTLLPDDPGSVSNVKWIEQGLELATLTHENTLIERYDARLARLLPTSSCLRENRDRRLLMNCRDATLNADGIFTTAGFTDRHLAILDGVLSPQQSFNNVIENAQSWGSEWFELAVICCAMHAWDRGDYQDAAEAAALITESDMYGRQAAQVTLSAIRAMMLREQIGRDEGEYYRDLIQSVFRYLAKHTEDSSIRTRVSHLLSVESCGDIGVPIVASIMLNLASEGVNLATSENAFEGNQDELGDGQTPTEEAVAAIVKQCLKWLDDQGSGEHGVTIFPKELAIFPDHTIRFVTRLILMTAPQGEDVDLVFLETLVLLVCAMAPHATSERNADLQVLRLLAGQCATVGQYQRARNLAEQALLIGQGDSKRSRLAWHAFADAYHRCRNLTEGLVGLVSAMATDAPVSKSDLWNEIHTAIRILRDLGLFDLANDFVPALKTLTTDLGHDAENDARIVTLELSLRLMKVDSDSSEMHEILDELSRAYKNAVQDRSFLFPIVVMMGQAIQKADVGKIEVSDEAREQLRAGLELVGVQAAHLVQTVSNVTPSASDVADMFNRVQKGMYASDSPGDFAFVGVAARRLLDEFSGSATSKEAKAFGVELLADHAITLPEMPPELESGWPARYAQTLNKSGLDVAFIGVDNSGELVITYVANGEIRGVEQPTHPNSFKKRLRAWLQNYPRNYGYIDPSDGHNEFYTTMEMLELRLPSANSLLVIAEPLLQQITYNLTIAEPNEAGGFSQFHGVNSAIGMAPSLTWFSLARSQARSGKTSYKAWISAEDGPEVEGPLDLALDRLRSTFDDFGFSIDTSRKLPRGMSDAALAVVTAHGGLTSRGRYIHSIRDEDSLLESPSALASSLAGVEVVILFVCSGGRIDKHPLDNTAVGLPKLLLDNGCRVVVASPWPLDVKVTYRWLEPFLREWEAGATVLQATKKANEAVGRALGEDPQYSLAMTVFGDLLLTKA